MGEKDIAEIQRLIPHKEFVAAWQAVEENGKELAKKLGSKDASTPSRAWRVLSSAKPEAILFLDVTSRQQAVSEKIKNYFGKWRQMQQKLPLPEMAEMRITPQLAEYPKIAEEAFLLLLDGKLRNHTEIIKFLKPYEPPLPPPPPPPRRRSAKAAVVKVAVTVPADSAAAAPKRGRKPKEAVAPGVPVEAIAAAAGEAPKKVAAKPAAAGEAPKKIAARPMAKPQAEKAKTKVTKPAPAKPAAKKAQPQPVKKIAKPQPAKKSAKKKPAPAKPAAKKTPAAKKPAKAPAKKPAKRK